MGISIRGGSGSVTLSAIMAQRKAKRHRAVRGFDFSLWRIFLTNKAASAVAVGMLFSTVGQIHAGIVNAASPLLGDVTVAVLAAIDGDTVVLPAGTAKWTSALIVNKAITLQGAGIGQTIILDSLPSNAPSPQSLLVFNTPANKNVRLTGFEFQADPNGRTTSFGQGVVQLSGSSNQVRVDHCKFVNVRNRSLYVSGSVFGVVDHCDIENGNIQQGPIYVYHDGILGPNGEAGSFGDGSWATPSNLGSANAMYFEDNTFNCPSTQFNPAITDANAGARFVVRHNTIHNHNLQAHGSGSTGRSRSARVCEIYENTMDYTPSISAQAVFMRGGTGVIFNNTVTGASPNSTFYFENYRANEKLSVWNGSNGMSSWDKNDTTDYTGNGLGGGPNGLWASGTAGSGSTGQTLVITGANFRTNQWRGFAVVNLDQPYVLSGVNFPNTFATVQSNTANTITVALAPHSAAVQVWVPGNHYEIRKVASSLDTIGAGPGDYLGGGANPTPRLLNQTNEPYYIWNNTLNGSAVAGSGGGEINSGWFVNFVNATKPGYTPYVYPHPLVSGASASATPSAPQNLRVTGP